MVQAGESLMPTEGPPSSSPWEFVPINRFPVARFLALFAVEVIWMTAASFPGIFGAEVNLNERSREGFFKPELIKFGLD